MHQRSQVCYLLFAPLCSSAVAAGLTVTQGGAAKTGNPVVFEELFEFCSNVIGFAIEKF